VNSMVLATVDLATWLAIVATLFAAAISVVVAQSSEWLQWFRGTAKHTIELDLPPTPPVLGTCQWNVLHIRDGNDGVIAELSEREQWFARLRNEVRLFSERERGFVRLRNAVRSFAGARRHSATKKATLRFYRPLGLQFKCFVDVENLDAASAAKRFLEDHGCLEISVKPAPREPEGELVRVWFLHPETGAHGTTSRYRILETKDGRRKNNMFYPT